MKKTYLIYTVLAFLIFNGCEEKLERFPLDELTVPTTFTTYSNVQTYAWSFYNDFGRHHWGRYDRDEHSADLMWDGRRTTGSDWLWQRITVPSSSGSWSNPYKRIRKVNIMLDNLENTQMNEIDINHWKSVGYFFRSYEYFELLKKYGGVPWVENAIDDSDTDVLYGPKTSRDDVAQDILDNLKYAEANIKADGEGSGTNTVGVNAVRALISRFGLFEGTWRKYHGLGGEATYLQASADASAQLLTDIPGLHPKYDEVFNSDNLKGVTGIILYKEYKLDQQVHPLNQWTRSSESSVWDLTKKAADMYLCLDGQSRWNSPQFDGDQNKYDEFRNRDRRMYYTITPPYEVVGKIGGNNKAWDYTTDPADREYIDLMLTLSDEQHKILPDINWAGFIQPICPNFRYGGSQNIPWDPGYNTTSSGYKQWKWFSRLKIADAWVDENDEPLFRIGEVMLNYAEAKYELGQFDQSIADMTINMLRTRGDVAPIVVGQIDAGFDPTRTSDVTPVLWEIRRERAVELMMEGFRFDDLRRWKHMNDEGAKEKLGRYIVSADYNNKIPIQNGAAAGYISREGVPPPFLDYYYLYPIPSDQIVLNPEIIQNPDWE